MRPLVHNRCPCSGAYDRRFVEVRMTVDAGVVVLDDVAQGACPLCGSRVYSPHVLEYVEATMYQRKIVERD